MLMVHCLLVTVFATMPSNLFASLYSQQRRGSRQRLQQIENLFRNAGLRRNQLSNNFNNTDWTRFVPTTPSTDEIDCHVEIEVVRSFGGKCVRLGGERQMAVCQSGMYLDVQNEECQVLLRQREQATRSGDNGSSGTGEEPGVGGTIAGVDQEEQ